MSWEFERASDVFDQVQADWDEVNRSGRNHIVSDSRFVSALLRHFGSKDLLLGIRQGAARPGMAILSRRRHGIWETFQPSQSPLGLMVVGGVDQSAEGVLDLLHQLPGYCLQVSVLHQDPEYSGFGPKPAGRHVEIVDHITIPRLSVVGAVEDYWHARSRKLKQNLQRYRRRVLDQGMKLECVSHETAGQMGSCVREYCRLETSGWKGKAGSAVADEGPQAAFYQEILEAFAATREAVIFELVLDGRVIASRLCLRRDGMLVMLKTAYDEDFRHISPGMLLMQDIVDSVHRDGQTRAIEFYGRTTWHSDWTSNTRALYHLNVLRYPWLSHIKRLSRRVVR